LSPVFFFSFVFLSAFFSFLLLLLFCFFFYTVEEAQLGVNHAEVGSWLLESWALDEEQVLPIAQHHCTALPDLYATESILIKLVDYLDHAARGHHYPPPEVEELESIGLGDLDQERWLQQHQTRISELNLSDQPQARTSD